MNLKTTCMGLKLRTPLVVSASPFSEGLDNFKRMEDAGVDVTMLCSVLMRHGIDHLRGIKEEMVHWLPRTRIRVGRTTQRQPEP